MKLLILISMMLFGASPLFGMRSPALTTLSDIKDLDKAFYLYHAEQGKYPSQENWQSELESMRLYIPLDGWKRPFIYRMPGKHGDYDLHSCGPDGIDNQGGQDDMSNWAGVNDGYHWKRNWPRGRMALMVGPAIAFSLLLLGFFYPWGLVVPFAGSIACLGVIYGGELLLHPAHTYYKELLWAYQIAIFCLPVLLIILIHSLWKRVSWVKERSYFSQTTSKAHSHKNQT